MKTRRPQPKLLESFLEDCFLNLRDDLRLQGGLLYAERRDNFALVRAVGAPGSPVAETLDASLAPLAEVTRHRVYIFREPDAEGSPHRLGLLPRAAVAALMVGQRPHRYAIFLVLADGWQMDELDFALNTIRASLDARLVDARVRGSFREAAEIQQSLLVEEPPVFAGYDIAARSVAADEVGGDFYDFEDFGSEMLGVSIGDAGVVALAVSIPALVLKLAVAGLWLALIETVSAKLRVFRAPEFMATAFMFAVLGLLVHLLLGA